jgi:hypothetical protein
MKGYKEHEGDCLSEGLRVIVHDEVISRHSTGTPVNVPIIATGEQYS